MKALSLVGAVLVGILIASSVGAFVRGENRVSNSDFEADTVGKPPKGWEIAKGG